MASANCRGSVAAVAGASRCVSNQETLDTFPWLTDCGNAIAVGSPGALMGRDTGQRIRSAVSASNRDCAAGRTTGRVAGSRTITTRASLFSTAVAFSGTPPEEKHLSAIASPRLPSASTSSGVNSVSTEREKAAADRTMSRRATSPSSNSISADTRCGCVLSSSGSRARKSRPTWTGVPSTESLAPEASLCSRWRPTNSASTGRCPSRRMTISNSAAGRAMLRT